MLNKTKFVLALLVLSAGVLTSSAVQGVRLSLQGSDVALRWPSQPCQAFIIGYRPSLDPSTPWTFLDTAYASASSGTETTYVHPNVVIFPPPGTGGGGGGAPPSPSSSQSVSSESATTSSAKQTPEQRAAQREALGEYLMAMLREAIARADADREKWKTEGRPSTRVAAESTSAAAAQPPLGSMGFYFVAEFAEDTDGDDLPNRLELDAGLHLLKADSDGDSIRDGDEDMDGDGVSNFHEALGGTLINEADSQYPPPLLPFGTVFFIDENFTLTCEPSGGVAPASMNSSQDMLFLDASADMAHGITAIETSPGVLNVKLHSIYIGPEFGASSPAAASPQKNNPFPKPSAEQLAILHQANGQTHIGSGRIGNIRQDLYDQLSESTLDWAAYESEYGLRKTERLIQEVASGQRVVSEATRRGYHANLITQAKRLSAATSSLARRFARAVGRHLPLIGGIMILSSASATAQDWQVGFENYAADIRNGDDTTGSAAIIAALSNDLSPGSGNFVLNGLLR